MNKPAFSSCGVTMLYSYLTELWETLTLSLVQVIFTMRSCRETRAASTTQGIQGKVGIPMTLQERPRGVMPGAWCNHAYPIAVQVYDGGRRAQCLRCLAVGPVRSDPDAARQALIEERSKR